MHLSAVLPPFPPHPLHTHPTPHVQEVLKRQQERKEVGDDVPYALARTMRSRVQYEASYMIGARGKGNQANRGKCMERALQVFCGKQMEGIPRAVVEALLRY